VNNNNNKIGIKMERINRKKIKRTWGDKSFFALKKKKMYGTQFYCC